MDASSPRETLLRMTNGFQVSQAIHVAATLGIADLLRDGPRAVEELANATGTSASAVRRLLRALASMGIFAEVEGGVAQTPLSEQLRSDLPGSVHAWALQIGQPYYWLSWGSLLASVRTARPAFEQRGSRPPRGGAALPRRPRGAIGWNPPRRLTIPLRRRHGLAEPGPPRHAGDGDTAVPAEVGGATAPSLGCGRRTWPAAGSRR